MASDLSSFALTTTSSIALLTPAKSHPEVAIQAVAARDRAKPEKFANSNNIPEAKGWYQGILESRRQRLTYTKLELLDDPNIDAIYAPLPNSHHYELALRCIRVGKHLLLGKPSMSNGAEAERFFNLPQLSQPGASVLLDALHIV